MNKDFTVIDLFSGCGGLSLGFEKAGFHILLGVDMWKDALLTYEYNHKNSKTLLADLAVLNPLIIQQVINNREVDVIIGGPPCQGYSIAGKRLIEDERNNLYKSFVSVVRHFKPRAFVLENVPNILSIGDGIIKDSIISDFRSLGYNVSFKTVTASDYGVPQNRKRAVFIGLLDNTFDFNFGRSSSPVTSYDALSDLPEHSLSDGEQYICPPLNRYQELMRYGSKGVYNHEETNHSQKTIDIISKVPDGGNYKNLPPELQNTRKVHIAWTRLNSQKPSITIDTGHRHHFHYRWNRIPTVRESARIQSFPDNFIFQGSKTSQYKQVGNAVPPLMAEAIAAHLIKYL